MSDGDLDVPAGSRTSSAPIEGGHLILNAGVRPGEGEHEVWRTPTNGELRRADEARAVAIADSEQARRAMLRIERDRLLRATDWTELPSAAKRLAPEECAAWEEYRQQLRDLPAVTVDVDAPAWPEAPAVALDEPAPVDLTGPLG